MGEKNESVPKRPGLTERLSSAAKAIHRSISPIPKYPHAPGNVGQSEYTGILDDIKELGFEDLDTLLTFLNAAVTGVDDDSNMLLEGLIQLLAKLPATSHDGKKLEDGLINQLWSVLDHPPVSSLGEQYKYREADGSYNSIQSPQMGAANTPYARSVPALTYQSPNLPDAGVVFDTLMSRGSEFRPHPNKISSVLFYLATIIIHDIFQTDSQDYSMNKTSSYLDLAPLYGRNAEEQAAVRTLKDGLLKPDCFSSKRILGFPPGVGVLLIMFNRFHNYVVTQLASINEGGRFTRPTSGDEAAWRKYDNDLFQTGRLITCGLYANIILRDYVRTILNLNRAPTSWALDPRTKEGKNIFSKPTPEGVGNQVSVEFNLIYRWHSTVSQRDEKWTIDEFKRLLGDKDPLTVDFHEVLKALKTFEGKMSDNPQERPFANLKRNPDGTLPDDALVDLFSTSVEDVAGAFGANGVPDILRPIEMLGILQARRWGVATLNEFRHFTGLTKYKTFEEINPDPVVAKRLMDLYDSPDSVELYPGLVAEKAKPPMAPGSGLCVNFTISRAILSDAVTLIRGDRFYTIDYTPKNLTNWGFNEASYDLNVDQSHVFYKLVYRAFPNHFRNNSIYAHYPFVVPSENKTILEKLEKAYRYSWAKPSRKSDLIIVRSHKAVVEILNNKKDFKTTWGEAIRFLVAQPDKDFAKNFCLSGDDEAHAANRKVVRAALLSGPWEQEVWNFYTKTAPKLLRGNSHQVGRSKSREVDVVRDVINLANVRFNAALFCLPLKTKETPQGIYTEQEMYTLLAVLFSSIFLDGDVSSSLKLRTIARELAQGLGQLVLLTTQAVAKVGFITDLVAKLREDDNVPSLPHFGNHLIERLLEKGKSVEEVVWGTIMPLITANVANQSQLLAQCVDYYLGDGKEHLPELYRLAHLNTKEADESLMKYMLEGCRLRGTVALYRDAASEQTVTDYAPCLPDAENPLSPNPVINPKWETEKQTIKIPAGRRVICTLATAGRDPAVFPEPDKVRLDRPIDAYMHFGAGPHICAGMEISRVAKTSLFKQIVGLKGLRRSPGGQGLLKSAPVRVWNGQKHQEADAAAAGVWTGLRVYMTSDQSSYWPVPSTLKVTWDE